MPSNISLICSLKDSIDGRIPAKSISSVASEAGLVKSASSIELEEPSTSTPIASFNQEIKITPPRSLFPLITSDIINGLCEFYHEHRYAFRRIFSYLYITLTIKAIALTWLLWLLAFFMSYLHGISKDKVGIILGIPLSDREVDVIRYILPICIVFTVLIAALGSINTIVAVGFLTKKYHSICLPYSPYASSGPNPEKGKALADFSHDSSPDPPSRKRVESCFSLYH